MAYDMVGLLARLEDLADDGYREFGEKLTPGGQPALGVRMPLLRGVAREILRGDWRAFLELSRAHPLHEMRMLHAMVLGGAKCPIGEKLALVDAFLPQVTNWAVCDCLCSSFKPRKGEEGAVFAFVRACADSGEEFRKRFGLIMMMDYFREPPYIGPVMEVYRRFEHPGYYARMGAAWGLATLFLYAREEALAILRDGVWDEFTHNKAIQKMIESYRVSEADKALLRGMRRRKGEA